MKNITKDIRTRLKNERGAYTIVEATIVFPVMFFVLFFIIFIGNMYYEQAKMDDCVMRYAIKGAQCCQDPLLYEMAKNGTIPTDVKSIKIEPYRYLLGGMDNVETQIANEMRAEIDSKSLTFFKNMSPQVSTKSAKYNNYLVYSTFTCQLNYSVTLPIRFWDDSDFQIVRFNSKAEVSVSDTPDFIRNVDFVVDFLSQTKAGSTIKSVFDKINSFILKFK